MLPGGGLIISDTGHHRILVTDSDGRVQVGPTQDVRELQGLTSPAHCSLPNLLLLLFPQQITSANASGGGEWLVTSANVCRQWWVVVST